MSAHGCAFCYQKMGFCCFSELHVELLSIPGKNETLLSCGLDKTRHRLISSRIFLLLPHLSLCLHAVASQALEGFRKQEHSVEMLFNVFVD